jgi:hypothetical protein
VPLQRRSAGRGDCTCGAGGQRRTACIITNALATASTNTQPAPSHANTKPAIEGPSARALFQAIDIAVMACGMSSRGTVSATLVFQAGDSSAVQQPAAKVKSSKVAGPAQPPNASNERMTTTATWTASACRISRRRSVVSASTPAGSASRNIGRNTAVCTSAARKEEPVSSTMSHEAAMTCMALPVK